MSEVSGTARPAGTDRRRVVVVGGGLTGLATAWHVRDEVDVVLLEAASVLGGQVRSVEFAGACVDVGADAFLARQPEAGRLVRAVGFGDEDLIAPATGQVFLWVRGRLRPLPAGTVMGVPTDLVAMARSGVLPVASLVRAALEPLLPRRRLVGDRSVADLVGERFGRDVVDLLVEPLLGGVYAGSTERLSAQSATASIWQASRQRRSLLLALRDHRQRSSGDDRPVFLTLQGGLGRLIDRLADDLGPRVRTSTPVTDVVRDPAGGGWQVTTGDGSVIDADAVVLAVPPAPLSALLAPTSPVASREVSGISTASVGVIALAYGLGDAAAIPAGSGILVPRTENRLVKAVTFSSRKWPHHASHDRFILRASVGRVDDASALGWDDERLIAAVEAELRAATGLRGRATDALVQRWPDALPQYDIGHSARIDRIRSALREDAPGLHVGGAAFDGLGLTARARDGQRLADEIRVGAGLSPRGTPPPGGADGNRS